MYVIKRNGKKQNVDFNKISKRIKNSCFMLKTKFVNVELITQKIINGLCPNIQTTELDNFIAEVCASMILVHPEYGSVAAYITITKLHKETKENFIQVVKDLHKHSLVSDIFFHNTMKNSKELELAIIYWRDFNLNYFGLKTLEKSYLLKIEGKIAERPQYMFMRVAIQIHGENLEKIIETYNYMSLKYFIHATPTLFNAGTPQTQLSSCFLMNMKGEKNIRDIYETITQCAIISKHAGGIGLAVHEMNNIVPMLRVFNDTARYVEQGNNKRPGSFAIYLEPWHFEIFEFLNLKKNTGNEEERARDLFYALWIPDLFMQRVEHNEMWSLMNPTESIGLSDCWGKTFNDLYEKYEKEQLFTKQIPARMLWRAIIDSQIETGTPFMLYKDACNAKSNQINLGTIKCSNLCTEIIEYSSKDEIAVCNLASIALNECVFNQKFNFSVLKMITKIITYNLNNIIDNNFYPLKEAEYSNKQHRPIGIGVQGLADTFFLMKYPFDSPEARKLNIQIFETIYYGALEASCELAKEKGVYDSFYDSPSAKGILQFDLWKVQPSNLWDWNVLKSNILKYGLRNSLLIALMPTASTAQILGNHESIEAFTNNIYTRRVLSGEFQIINKYLVKDLMNLNLWNESMKNKIITNDGSVQNIKEIPDFIKSLYKTAWEISQKTIIDMAVDRAPYVDQSQSLNIYMANPNFSKLTSMHFYGWNKGLKTGMYYLRSKGAAKPIQFTVDKECLTCSA